MFNPQSINPLTLPSVPLEMRSQLPTIPCIYFAIDSEGVVQYIGRSINLQQRWIQHHRQHQLKSMSAVQITWLAVDTLDLLPEIEAALIEWFNPRLNQTKVVSNSNKVSTYVDQKLKELAEKVAANQGRSLSNYIEQLIRQDVVKAQKEEKIGDD